MVDGWWSLVGMKLVDSLQFPFALLMAARFLFCAPVQRQRCNRAQSKQLLTTVDSLTTRNNCSGILIVVSSTTNSNITQTKQWFSESVAPLTGGWVTAKKTEEGTRMKPTSTSIHDKEIIGILLLRFCGWFVVDFSKWTTASNNGPCLFGCWNYLGGGTAILPFD